MASAADLRRPLGLSYFRRGGADQIHAMDTDDDDDIASFHRHLGDIFLHLSANSAGGLLSIDWLRKLLDTFLLCQEEFRIILCNHGAALTPDFLDRSIKALDLLNAVRDGIDQLRQRRNHLDIVLASLSRSPFSQGQLRRAHKALLAHLDTTNNDDTTAAAAAALPRRNRSFGRPPNNNAHRRHFRSLSWSVSRSWSAARQLQALATNLAAPRAQDVAASRGLANLFYAMSSVVLFVSFALVAAIPCQDRGLHAHFSVPRCFPWGAPMVSMHERIVEESKKRERNQASGLLSEVLRIEKCAGRLMELIDKSQVHVLSGEGEVEVKREVEELAEVCRVLKEGLDPLEHQVREVFHRIVRFRTKGLNSSSTTTLIEA